MAAGEEEKRPSFRDESIQVILSPPPPPPPSPTMAQVGREKKAKKADFKGLTSSVRIAS